MSIWAVRKPEEAPPVEWVKGKLFHPPTDTEKKRNDLLTQAGWRSH
jgi:hypothetical protein